MESAQQNSRARNDENEVNALIEKRLLDPDFYAATGIKPINLKAPH